MTPREREELRVWAEAELTCAQRLDPDDTMTLQEAIVGHEDLVEAIYHELLAVDAVLVQIDDPAVSDPDWLHQ